MEQTNEFDTDLIQTQNQESSLIKYDNQLIDEEGNRTSKNAATMGNENELQFADENNNNLNDSKSNKQNNVQLREILNCVLPPVKVSEYGEFKQVSSAAASREDVITLQRAWDDQLQIRQARETGICAIREELNEQAFNELIRQITINLPERGLLALRVRDEAKMTIQTYQTLYQSSLAFGMRKCIQSQNEIEQLEQQMKKLQEEKANLARKLKELQVEKQNFEKLYSEQNQIDQKTQNQEMEFLKHQKEQLQSYLKTEFGK